MAQEVNKENAEQVVYVLRDLPASEASNSTVDLFDLVSANWRNRWLIAGVAALFGGIAVGYALTATKWYRADVLLMPAAEQNIPAGLAGNLGSIASLAGINLSGSNSSQEPVAVLQSKEFTEEFISDLKLLDTLQADSWMKWGRTREPDIRDAVEYFRKHVRTVSEDKKTGLITLSVEWKDPRTAAQWANILVSRLNDRMRGKALSEAERNVAYLQKEMTSTSIVPMQQVIGRQLESEMQKLMLARGNEEFSFKVLDRAQPPKKRSRPVRTQLVGIAMFLGAFAAAVYVSIRHVVRARS